MWKTALDTDTYPSSASDFYPILTKAVAKDPDMINTDVAQPGSVYLIVKQARELGYEGLIGGMTSAPDLVDVVGAEYAEGFCGCMTNYDSPIYNEAAKDFDRSWREQYPGSGPLRRSSVAYISGCMCVFQAIETAGSIETDEVLKVFDDPNWRYDLMGYEGTMCGLESNGILRIMAMYAECAEIINGEDVVPERYHLRAP